jgi:hypothetical protein
MTVDTRALAEKAELAMSNPFLLGFLALTLFVTMTVGQEVVPETGSLTYWLLVLPALIFPLFNVAAIVRTAATWPAILLLVMLAIAGSWQMLQGDPRSALRLALIVMMLIWVSSPAARLRDIDLGLLYALLLLLGILVFFLTGENKWGPFPGTTVEEYGIWRVSFFPNIAYTAFLSLAIVMAFTRTRERFAAAVPLLTVAAFFLTLSFVRTALIALVVYAVIYFVIRGRRSMSALFWLPLAAAIGINAAIAVSPLVLQYLQDVPFISRLLLRGETGLDTNDIFIQLFRPWVWWQHLQIMMSSPFLMGRGADFDFNALKTESLIDVIDWSDLVSMPTRLLAAYGVPAVLFLVYLVAQLWRRAREGDAWSCACFAPTILIAMQWGSMFHPADPMFALYFMPLLGGSTAYVPLSQARGGRVAADR